MDGRKRTCSCNTCAKCRRRIYMWRIRHPNERNLDLVANEVWERVKSLDYYNHKSDEFFNTFPYFGHISTTKSAMYNMPYKAGR